MKKGILLILAAFLLTLGVVGIAYASDSDFEAKIQRIFVSNTEPILIKLDGQSGSQIPDVISVKTAPQKWEYIRKFYYNPDLTQTQMNELGEQGWELFQFETGSASEGSWTKTVWRRPIN